MAAVTNYQKPDGLKQHLFSSSSEGQKSEIHLTRLKLNMLARLIPPNGSEGSISLPISAYRGCLHSFTCGFNLASLQPLASIITSPATDSDPLPPSCKDPCDYTVSTQII